MYLPQSQPPLRGRTLPIPFTLGWMLACLDNFGGSGGVPMLFTMAFRDWFSDLTTVPLYSYYRRAHVNANLPVEPVDYWFLSQFRESINDGYGRPQAKSPTQRLGQTWWASGYGFLDRRHAS